MPTYAYACTVCEHRFEAHQSFTDSSLTVCPECSGRLRKIFPTVGVVFKGSGFYHNDSRSSHNGRIPAGTSSNNGDAGSGSSSDSGDSAAKPAAAAASAPAAGGSSTGSSGGGSAPSSSGSGSGTGKSSAAKPATKVSAPAASN